MERSFCFVEDERIGAVAKDRDGLTGALYAGDFDDAGASGFGFFDEFGVAEFVFGEGVDVGDRFAAGAL